MAARRLYLIRHGLTYSGETGVSVHDDPLSATGHSQAALASTHPALSQTTLVLVSPLSRAMDTALAIFGDRPHVTLHVTPALREFNLHQRESGLLKERHVGLPVEELRLKYGSGGGERGGGWGSGKQQHRCTIVWDAALDTPEWWEPHGDAYARAGESRTAPTCMERVEGLLEDLSRGAYSPVAVGGGTGGSGGLQPSPPLVIVAHENVFRALTGTPCFVNCSVVGATLVVGEGEGGVVGRRLAVHVDGLYHPPPYHPTPVFLPSLLEQQQQQQLTKASPSPLTPVRHLFALYGCDDLELYQARAARAFKEAAGCGGIVLGLLATTQFLPAIDDVKARLVAGTVPHSMAYSTFVCDLMHCEGNSSSNSSRSSSSSSSSSNSPNLAPTATSRALFHLKHLGGKWVVHVVTHDFQMPSAMQEFWGAAAAENSGAAAKDSGVVCIQACAVSTPFPLLARIGGSKTGRALGLEGLWGDDAFRDRYVGRWGWGDLLAIGRNVRGGAGGGGLVFAGVEESSGWWDALASGDREGVKRALLLGSQQGNGGGGGGRVCLTPPPGSLAAAAGAGHRDLCLDLICWAGCAAYTVGGGEGEEGMGSGRSSGSGSGSASEAALKGGHRELARLLEDIAGMQLYQDLRF